MEENKNHGMIMVTRVVSNNINAVQLASRILSNNMGGSFATVSSVRLAVNDCAVTASVPEDVSTDGLTELCKTIREFIENKD